MHLLVPLSQLLRLSHPTAAHPEVRRGWCTNKPNVHHARSSMDPQFPSSFNRMPARGTLYLSTGHHLGTLSRTAPREALVREHEGSQHGQGPRHWAGTATHAPN